MFYVGQKVVCVADANPSTKAKYPSVIWPEKGVIYEIRALNDWPTGTLVRLAEIDNSHMVPEFSKIEPGFTERGFRPLTDISIFDAMLDYQPTPETEDA